MIRNFHDARRVVMRAWSVKDSVGMLMLMRRGGESTHIGISEGFV